MLNMISFFVAGVIIALPLHIISEGFWRAYHHERERLQKSDFSIHFSNRKWHLLSMILLSGFGTSLILSHYGTNTAGFFALGFLYLMLILTFIDLAEFVLPNLFTFGLIALGVLQSVFPLFTNWQMSLMGLAIGYGSLWLVNFLFVKIRHKQGMGIGDFKLFGAIGAWTGPLLLPVVIFLAALIGVLFAVIRASLLKQSLSQPFPFGPSLALSGIICLLYGHKLLAWYVGLVGG